MVCFTPSTMIGVAGVAGGYVRSNPFWIQKSAGFLRLRRGSRGARGLLVCDMEPGFAFGPCTCSVLCTLYCKH